MHQMSEAKKSSLQWTRKPSPHIRFSLIPAADMFLHHELTLKLMFDPGLMFPSSQWS